MSIETDLKEYIKNKFGSIRSFAFELDVTPSTIYSILKNGIGTATTANMKMICNLLNISMDALIMDEKIVPYYRSAPKPERDVEDRLSHIHDELKNGSTMIDGQIADDKAIELIVTSAKVGIQLAKDHMKSEEE